MSGGYSTTLLAKKLGIGPGYRVLLVGAPPDWGIPDLPVDARITNRAPGPSIEKALPVDVVVAFFRQLSALSNDVEHLSRTVDVDGALWLAWPRRAAGHRSDITDNAVRECAVSLGLVDMKVAALGEDWSGLKTVWRRALRAGLPAARSERASGASMPK